MKSRLLTFVLVVSIVSLQAHSMEGAVEIWPEVPESQKVPTRQEIVERGDPEGLRDRYVAGTTEPTLTIFPAGEPTGQSLLIIPGGGYQRVVIDKEGYETAEWFQARGVTCFVLLYRLPGEGWSHRSDVPLQDAQRAMRWIRAHAGEYAIREDQVGVLGFSAGGHLAASLATGFDRPVYEPLDEWDEFSARPDYAVLMYPVISMREGITHRVSRNNLLGHEPSAELVERYSAELNVTSRTPTTFLVHASDDGAVPVENSLLMYKALRGADVPADLHVFAQGGHGFGMRYALDKPIADWPSLVHRWMQENLQDP